MTLNRKAEEYLKSSKVACLFFLRSTLVPTSLTIAGFLSGTTLFARQAWAQTVVPATDGVGTVVTTEGNRIDITGGTPSGDGANLFHSFSEFGLSAEQIGNFEATPDIQNILGRITGGDASIIDGWLQISGGNANLFLINPAGVLLGPNVQLNLPGSFTATTATSVGFDENWFDSFGTNNYELLTGTPDAFAFDLSEPGAVVNTGTLELGQNQSLMLLGGTVVNTGTLATAGGEVTIAAVPGENIVRVSHGNQLLSLDLETIDAATNLPETQLPQGFSPLTLPELLTGGEVPATPDIVVEADGTVRLTVMDTVIPDEPSLAISAGDLDVSGDIGGDVAVVGDRVGLVSGQVDASGVNGGGTVRVGGDYQGQGTVPNSIGTYVGSDAVIDASALTAGDGGQVIFWSDEVTRFYGEINARGGQVLGSGGFAEVSGRESLIFDGEVDVASIVGRNGTILLDPANIKIVADAEVSIPPEIINDNKISFSEGSETLELPARTLENLNGEIILEATRDISFLAPVDLKTPGTSLRVRANNNISINENIKSPRDIDIRGQEIDIAPGVSLDSGRFVIFRSPQDVVVGASEDNPAALDITLDELNAIESAGEVLIQGANDVSIDAFSSDFNFPISFDFGDGTVQVNTDIRNSEKIDIRGQEIDIASGVSLDSGDFVIFRSPQDVIVGALPGDNPVTLDITLDELDAIESARAVLFQGEDNVFINNFPDEFNFPISFDFRNETVQVNANVKSPGNIDILGREIDFAPEVSIESDVKVILRSDTDETSPQDIIIGSEIDNPDTLDITLDELKAIQGETELEIVGANNVVVDETLELDFPLDLELIALEGTVQLDEDVIVQGFLSIIDNSDSLPVKGDITTERLFYNSNGPINIIDDISITLTGENAIFSNEVIANNDASLRLTSQSDLTITSMITAEQGDISLIADSDADGTGELTLNSANVTTNGNFLATAGEGILINNSTIGANGAGNISLDSTGGSDAGDNHGILITNSTIESNGAGDISLNGIGGDGAGTNHGIFITNNSLIISQGNTTLNGTGGVAGINTDGIAIDRDSIVQSEADITLLGTGGGGGDAQGISIAAVGSSTIQTNDGDITLQGNAGVGNGNSTLGNHGVLIENAGRLESRGNGDIIIDGIGGQTLNTSNVGNAGVTFKGNAIARTGNIVINGIGGTQTDLNEAVPTGNHHGVSLDTAQLSAAEEINITGAGGIGQGSATSGSQGISIFNSNVTSTNNDIALTGGADAVSAGFANHGIGINNSRISVQGEGAISIDGRSDATNSGTAGFGNDGISISNNSRVDSNSGPILITGVSGNGTADPIDGNQGIVLLGGSEIASVDGNIQLNGTGRGPGENDYNIWLGEFGRGSLQTTGAGSIFITSENTSKVGGDRIFLGDSGLIEASGSGDIYITSDEAALLSDTARITGNGNLFLQTLTPDLDISFGGTPTGNGLHFESNEFGTIQSQIAKVLVGNTDSNNSIFFNENTTFTSALELLSSDITLNDSTVSIAGNSLTINRSDVLNINGSGSFTTNGGNITLQGTDINVAPQITLDSSSNNGTGGFIDVTATENSVSTGDLNSSGNIGGPITVEAIIEITAGAINSSGNVGKGGDVSLDPIGDIQVTSINTQGGTNGSGGDVTVVTGQFFRATGSFTDQNDIDASISTAGTTGNGNITIFHDGGARGVPFIVGDASVNGTAGAITTGADNSILPNRSFPGSYFQGDISIITTDVTDEIFPEIVLQPQEILDNPLLAEQLVFQLEDLFTRDYETHFERGDKAPIKTLGEIQKELNLVQSITENTENPKDDITPAIIYAFFIPERTDDFDTVALEQAINQFDPNSSRSSLSADNQWQFASDSLGSQNAALRQLAIQDTDTTKGELALLMVTGRNKPIFRATGFTLDEVTRDIRNLRTELNLYHQGSLWNAPARSLYSYLIKPLEEELEELEINNLLFVTDTELRTVPFASFHENPTSTVSDRDNPNHESFSLLLPTLINDEGRFLIEDYSIGLIPTASLTDLSYRDISRDNPLVMGTDTEFSDVKLPDLPGVPTEMSYLKNQWQADVIGDDVDEAFTVDTFSSSVQQGDFSVVHLATHAEFNSGDASQSMIHFEDRPLTLLELPNIDLDDIDLLVLSACETALGNREAELGFAGIAYQAGVKSTLASLNSVSDEGTAALMAQFYANLKDEPIKAQALRRAQLAMLNNTLEIRDGQIFGEGSLADGVPLQGALAEVSDRNFSHPYFWSWFTIIGSPW